MLSGNIISCFGGASEAVSARIGSTWKKFHNEEGRRKNQKGQPSRSRKWIEKRECKRNG